MEVTGKDYDDLIKKIKDFPKDHVASWDDSKCHIYVKDNYAEDSPVEDSIFCHNNSSNLCNKCCKLKIRRMKKKYADEHEGVTIIAICECEA
jgi:hypothetical protein